MDEPSSDDERFAALLEALRLGHAGEDRFRVVPPAWWGARVFGGMVLALVVRAASAAVTPPLRVHSMHGYFLRPLAAEQEAELVVERLRDSRSFATRQVDLVQAGRLAARMLCSFTDDASEGDRYEPPMPGDVPAPDDLEGGSPPGPFDARDAGAVRNPDGTYRSSGRFWTRTVGTIPPDPVLHACLLALMSDMTRTSFRPPSLDRWGSHTDASIDHALWFHRPVRADQWLFYDLFAVINLAERATVRGAMYTRGGELAVTMTQELLIRPLEGGGEDLRSGDAF